MQYQTPVRVLLMSARAVVHRKVALFRVLVIPVIVWLCCALFIDLDPSFASPLLNLALYILFSMLSIFMFVVIAVSTHRVILIEERIGSVSRLKLVGNKEWQYILALFELMFYCLPCAVFLFIPNVGATIATVIAAYVVSRLSLIFPSIAIDVPMNPRASWQATKQHQILMFIVVFVFSLVFTSIEWLMTKAGVPGFIVSVFSVISIVFLVAALSEAYKEVMSSLESDQSQ
jgi:hypothetical protein